MNYESSVEKLFEVLIAGDRPAARHLIQEAESEGATASELITELFWPTYQLIDRLFRQDQLTCVCHHMAIRLLRVLVDQRAAHLTCEPSRGRTIFAFCGPAEAEELGAQMAVDLLEGAGFRVRFAGGGVANDEILAQVNETRPDILLAFSSAAQDLPNIRALVDTLHEIGACPNLQIAVGGGVFNRADGLAEEIGADLWASSPIEIVETLMSEPARRAESGQRTVGKNRRKRLAA